MKFRTDEGLFYEDITDKGHPAVSYTHLTIFLTSHFMDEVEALCDRICILKKGKIVYHGTVSGAVESSPCETFEDAYLWYTDEEGNVDENI